MPQFLSKLGWKLLKGENCLWTEVIKAKYLQEGSLLDYSNKRRASHTWKGILSNKETLVKGSKWCVGDGTQISIWFDWWCGESNLASLFPHSPLINSETVNLLLDEEGGWDIFKLNSKLPREAIDLALKVHLPRFVTYPDTPHWHGSGSGDFSTASAYEMVAIHEAENCNWLWLWKLKLPQKIKGFVWLVLHGKLLSNSLRIKKGLTDIAECSRCGCQWKDIDHIFGDCPKAVIIWSSMGCLEWLSKDRHIPLTTWLESNLKNKPSSILDPTLFAVILWQIWKDRNKKVFDNVELHWYQSILLSCKYASAIKKAFRSFALHPSHYDVVINWCPPFVSKLKMNTDGSTKGDPGEGGFGGLIRDERGIWLIGYYGKLDVCTSLEVELWAIYRGLTIAFEKGYKDLTIETDSLSAIELLKEGSVVSSSIRSLVEDSKFLMQRCGYTIQHVLREGNNSADSLAKLGATQAEPLVVMDEAPVEIRGLVIADMVGRGYLRP
ncbi:hypothetical protein ACSBR1_002914 [Camellia fascicularis]